MWFANVIFASCGTRKKFTCQLNYHSNLNNTCIYNCVCICTYIHIRKHTYFYLKLKLKHSENGKTTFFCDINVFVTRNYRIVKSGINAEWIHRYEIGMLRALCEFDCALLTFYICLLHLDGAWKIMYSN